jgi:hypothetical protein
MDRLSQIAEANTALSVSNFKGAVAIPSALGLNPAAAKCVPFSLFYFPLCGFQVARHFHCWRLKCSYFPPRLLDNPIAVITSNWRARPLCACRVTSDDVENLPAFRSFSTAQNVAS